MYNYTTALVENVRLGGLKDFYVNIKDYSNTHAKDELLLKTAQAKLSLKNL